MDAEEERERERARRYARNVAEAEARRQAIEHRHHWIAMRAMLETEAAKHPTSCDGAERQARDKLKEQERRLRQWRASTQASAPSAPQQQPHGTPVNEVRPDAGPAYSSRGGQQPRTPPRSPRRPRSPCSPRTHQKNTVEVLASPYSPLRFPQSPELGPGRRLPRSPELGPGRRRPALGNSESTAAVGIQIGTREHATHRVLTPEGVQQDDVVTEPQAAVGTEHLQCKEAAAVKVQSAFRGWKCREHYLDMLDQILASEQIQAAFRGWQVRSALVAEAEALMANDSEAVRSPKPKLEQSDVEGEAQIALESVRRGLLARAPEDIADAFAAMDVLGKRLAELSLHYDKKSI